MQIEHERLAEIVFVALCNVRDEIRKARVPALIEQCIILLAVVAIQDIEAVHAVGYERRRVGSVICAVSEVVAHVESASHVLSEYRIRR